MCERELVRGEVVVGEEVYMCVRESLCGERLWFGRRLFQVFGEGKVECHVDVV